MLQQKCALTMTQIPLDLHYSISRAVIIIIHINTPCLLVKDEEIVFSNPVIQ